jgi:VWFA-related protein
MRRPWFAVLVFFILAVPTAASELADDVVFRGRLDVNLVTLNVTVLDREGRPLVGLGAGDFTVFEDGETAPVAYFEPVEPPEVGPRPTEGATAGGSRDGASVSAVERGDGVAVVFDNTDLERRTRQRVIDALLEMVPGVGTTVPPTAVASVDDRFDVAAPFVEDPETLRAAYARVASAPTGGEARKAGRKMLLRDINRASAVRGRMRGAPAGLNEAEAVRLRFRIEAFREEELIRLERTLALLESMVRALAARPGRTSLVWVTEDLSLRPALDVYRRYWRLYQEYDPTLTPPDMWGFERDLHDTLQDLVARAQASGVTIHVVDASDRDREVSEMEGYDFTGIRDVIEGAQMLGYESGGGFYGGTRNFAPFVEGLEAVTTSYYVIGYERPPAGDGVVHSIRVEVHRPGVTVRYPEKVLDRTPDMRLEDDAIAAARWVETDRPIAIGLELFDEPASADDGTRRLPLELRVPVRWLVPGADGEAPVSAVLVSAHADGRLSAPAWLRLAIDQGLLEDGDAAATARVELAVSPDVIRVGVAVRDDTSGAVRSGRLQLD